MGLLSTRLKNNGIKKTVALTHGHEVGWAFTPGLKQTFQKIVKDVDKLTYLTKFTYDKIAEAISTEDLAKFEQLTPGIDVENAINLALTKVSTNSVDTHWSDATIPAAPWQKAQSDPDWAGEALYKDTRERVTDASIENLWKAIEEIGGDNGWYGADFLDLGVLIVLSVDLNLQPVLSIVAYPNPF